MKNKMRVVGLAVAMTAGVVTAQNGVVMVGQAGGSDASQTLVTAEASLMSSYVCRGRVLNNDSVIQSQITAFQNGVSLNIWGNYDLGKAYNGSSSDFSEMDVSLAYTLPVDINEMAFDVGIINYNFPGNGSGSIEKQATTELFVSATILSWEDYFIPSVTMFGDIDEARGTYFLFDVVVPYQVSDYLDVEAGVSAGWGNTSYNDYYWGTAENGYSQDEGFNDYNFYANASYEISENLTAAVNLTYTMLEGGSVRTAAKELYEADGKIWGGVNIAYDF